MKDIAYIMQRMLEDKIAIAENNNQNTLIVTLDVLKEILALLKEQITTSTNESRIFHCKKCGYGIDDIFLSDEHNYPIEPCFCPNCGRLVKWDD